MTRLSERTTMRKVFILILSIVVVLLMFYIGMPLFRLTFNTLHCQNTGKIVVRSLWNDTPFPSDHIEVVCADGSGAVYHPQPLSSVAENAQDAVYSPDRRRIAVIPSMLQDDLMPYLSQENRDHIWIMNSDNSGLVRLSNIHRHESDPAWSPDGQRLAFSASMTDERDYGIYVMDLKCVDTRQDCVSSTTLLVANGWCPAWSPDGKRIAFRARDSSDPNFLGEIFVIDVNGSNRVNLTHNPADDACPVWSPDGRRIAFYSWREPAGIYMMNADGSNQTFLTEGEKPKWSPDNRFIAFTSTRDNRGEVIPLFPDSAVPADALYLITLDGSRIIKLTHHDNESITDYFWLP